MLHARSISVRAVQSQEIPAAVDVAAQVHVFAGAHGLAALARFCAAFLAVHVAAARAAPSWRQLGAKELEEVRRWRSHACCVAVIHAANWNLFC